MDSPEWSADQPEAIQEEANVPTQKVKWAVSGRAKDSRRPLRLAELLPA
jgi:hypothetical protein